MESSFIHFSPFSSNITPYTSSTSHAIAQTISVGMEASSDCWTPSDWTPVLSLTRPGLIAEARFNENFHELTIFIFLKGKERNFTEYDEFGPRIERLSANEIHGDIGMAPTTCHVVSLLGGFATFEPDRFKVKIKTHGLPPEKMHLQGFSGFEAHEDELRQLWEHLIEPGCVSLVLAGHKSWKAIMRYNNDCDNLSVDGGEA